MRFGMPEMRWRACRRAQGLEVPACLGQPAAHPFERNARHGATEHDDLPRVRSDGLVHAVAHAVQRQHPDIVAQHQVALGQRLRNAGTVRLEALPGTAQVEPKQALHGCRVEHAQRGPRGHGGVVDPIDHRVDRRHTRVGLAECAEDEVGERRRLPAALDAHAFLQGAKGFDIGVRQQLGLAHAGPRAAQCGPVGLQGLLPVGQGQPGGQHRDARERPAGLRAEFDFGDVCHCGSSKVTRVPGPNAGSCAAVSNASVWMRTL